jgi:hypothetical protein
MAGLRFLQGLAIMAVVVATLLLPLATAHASPPDPTLAAPPIDPPAPALVEDRPEPLTISGESLWTGLHGDAVILALRDGGEVHGTVVAHSTHAIRLARVADGLVVSLAKSDIARIRVVPRPEPAPAKKAGRGLIGGGAVLLTIGSAATLSGTTMLAVYPEYTFIHLPLLLPGLAMLGGGVAMVIEGRNRRRDQNQRWDARAARPRLRPIASISHRSAYVGLTLNF